MSNNKDNRDEYIVAQFLPPNYRTMQDIGDELGISRQRVHQILARNDVKASDGGISAKSRHTLHNQQLAQAKKRQQSIQDQYGCSEQEAMRINGGQNLSCPKTPAYKYKAYRNNLSKKGIECKLSFPDWYKVWKESGKYGLMRPGKNGYSMVRKDPTKGASINNVKIIESSQSSSNYHAAQNK